MDRSKKRTGRRETGESRFASADLTTFLILNLKFLALLTLVLSVVAIALALLIPGQYTKQLNLSVRAVPTQFIVKLDQLPLITVPELSNQAAVDLQRANLGGVETDPRYNPQTQQVEVSLASSDEAALNKVGPRTVQVVKDGLRRAYEQRLSDSLETQLLEQEVRIEDQNDSLAEIESQIEQVPSAGGTEGGTQTARLESLEALRADTVTEIAQAEDKRDDFKQARGNLPELAREAAAVELTSETEATRSRTLPTRIALAIISAFILATLATIIRAAMAQNG